MGRPGSHRLMMTVDMSTPVFRALEPQSAEEFATS